MTDLIKAFFLPSHIVAVLLSLGVISLIFARTRQKAKYPFVAGAIMYLIFSNGLVAATLMAPLEYRYPALTQLSQYSHVDTAVVLTAFATDDRNMPLSSRAGSSTLYRILEVSRLYYEANVQRILITGDTAAAVVMKELLISIGVPEEIIDLDKGAEHTFDSVRHVKQLLPDQDFFLVTSAGHMPRALGVFRAAGVNPVPAPTDFQLPRNPMSASMMPSPFHLYVSDLAIHEYAGLLWYRVSGKTAQIW